VVAIAPEVAGRIVDLRVADNRPVHKDELLLVIDPTNYEIALKLAEAAVTQARALADNAAREAERRAKLTDLAVSPEEQQSYTANATAVEAK
jgi:multidrug resistance efflux pump